MALSVPPEATVSFPDTTSPLMLNAPSGRVSEPPKANSPMKIVPPACTTTDAPARMVTSEATASAYTSSLACFSRLTPMAVPSVTSRP